MKALSDYFIPHVDEGICMAFSGGVDSSASRCCLPAAKAAGAAGSDKPVLAVTFATRLHPQGGTARLRPSPVLWAPCTVLSKLTSSLTAVFTTNPKNRCYLCKSLLFQSLLQAGQEAGYTFFSAKAQT